MPSGSRVRFLVVSDEPVVEGYLRREFAPCAGGRTCVLTTVGLRTALTRGLPPGPWDVLLLAAGKHASPDDARRLKSFAPAARLIVVSEEDGGEERRLAYLAAGASAVMNRAAAAASSFHGIRPCGVWRRRQTDFLLRLRRRVRTLRELEARRRAFLDDIFHELRSPLTVVMASIRLLLEDEAKGGDPERLALVNMAARNCDHMLHRVVTILERSKLESGVIKAERAPFELEPLAQEVRAECLAAAARPLEVVVRVRSALPPVFADRVMVEQVLRNLLDNAVRFAHGRILVVLRAHPGDGTVQVSVVDDGPGIDPAKAEHLFERFLQGARPTGVGYKGMGLGLGICRDLLALNDGRIWAGTRRGVGAHFHFTLPAVVVAGLEAPHGTMPLGR
ncbi:HAMP domain-containing histidine kinase [bacterium]|nr:MAG: HAMP domain-containing histidine kinase [bacterium]